MKLDEITSAQIRFLSIKHFFNFDHENRRRNEAVPIKLSECTFSILFR